MFSFLLGDIVQEVSPSLSGPKTGTLFASTVPGKLSHLELVSSAAVVMVTAKAVTEPLNRDANPGKLNQLR